MDFKFIGNACGIFYGNKGTKILCDPWINDGVFEGSWFHYPPLKTKIEDLYKIDAIYISHIHPDHFDDRFFSFPKDIPIIILNEGPNFLKKNLIRKGYSNLVEIKDNESVTFKEFKITMFKPFVGHIFEESLLGNLIDSAIVLQDDLSTCVNFNDNTPDLNSCVKLNKKFPNIDLAMLNYNAAGPYPSCFDNLSENEKKSENKRILKRNFDHLCNIIPFLKPKAILPFAGSYILAGKNNFKNQYLGTTTWDECADYLMENLKTNTYVLCLREGDIFNLERMKSNKEYKRIDTQEMDTYIKKIKNVKYVYEEDCEPNLDILRQDIFDAKSKLSERLKNFKLNIKSKVYLKFENELIKILDGSDSSKKLICSMDNRLLRRILDKKSHWNNAEIGAHINFFRKPNKMDPDAHTSLSFFHL